MIIIIKLFVCVWERQQERCWMDAVVDSRYFALALPHAPNAYSANSQRRFSGETNEKHVNSHR